MDEREKDTQRPYNPDDYMKSCGYCKHFSFVGSMCKLHNESLIEIGKNFGKYRNGLSMFCGGKDFIQQESGRSPVNVIINM